jgi:hypothetical protein
MDDPSVIHDLEQAGSDAVSEAEQTATHIVAHVENVAASLLHDAEKDVIAALGHVHNLLSAMSGDVSAAKASVEAAILQFAKHLG